MSICEMIKNKVCSCGNFYKTDCSTLGVNRDMCGMCDIVDRIDNKEEIVGIVYYIVSKSNIEKEKQKDITRKLLEDKLDKDIIEDGFNEVLLSEIYSILDRKSIYMIEVRKDLAEYLKEDDNINDLIKRMLKKCI